MTKGSLFSRQLLRVALYSSPLLAMLRMVPVLLLIREGFMGEPEAMGFSNVNILILFGSLSCLILLQWYLNIRLFVKEEYGFVSLFWRYFISFSFCVFLVSIPSLMWGVLGIKNLPIIGLPQTVYRLISTFANNGVILLIIHLFLSRERASELKLKNTNLYIETLRSDRERLSQQLQPHFLFNSLYTLKLLMDDTPEVAKSYLTKLAYLLRTSINGSEEECVPTSEEMKFLRNYVDLQKMRFGVALQYVENVSGEVLQETILPAHSLQLLAENAIKHNKFTRMDPLVLSVFSDEQGRIVVKNNRKPHKKNTENLGLGLANLNKRFVLLGGVKPIIEFDENQFEVTLTAIDL